VTGNEGHIVKLTEPEKKCAKKWIYHLAVDCYPPYRNIITIALQFMNRDFDDLQSPKYKSEFINKLKSDYSFDPPSVPEKSSLRSMAKKPTGKNLHNNLLQLVEGMSPTDKKALAYVLESGCTHPEVYQCAHRALRKYSITKKEYALNILARMSKADFDCYAIENVIRFFVKNSNSQKICKEERLGDCEVFWWKLDAAAIHLRSITIPYTEFPEKNFPVYGTSGGDAESSPKLKMAVTSKTKKALTIASKLAATMATQEKDALEIVGTSVMFAYMTTCKSLIDDQVLEEAREFYLEHIRYLFSQPALWSDLSETLAYVHKKAATKLDIGRMEALQTFSGICIAHAVPQKKNIRFSRSTDFYAIASYFLEASGDLHKSTFENDFKKAYEIMKAKVKS